MSRDFASRVLPSLLQENRFRSQEATRVEESQKLETEKKLIVEFGSAVQSLDSTARTEEEFVSGYEDIKRDFAGRGLTPQALQLGRQLLKAHVTGIRDKAKLSRQSLLDERADIKEAQGQTDLKALSQIGNLSNQPQLLDDAGRGEGAARSDLESLLSFPAQQTLTKSDRATKTFDLSQKVKKAQLKKATTPVFTKRTLFKPDGSSVIVTTQAEYDDAIKKDFSRVKPGKAGTSKAKSKGDLALKRADRILKVYAGREDEFANDITPYQAMKASADEGDTRAKSDLSKYEKFVKDAEGFYDEFNKVGGPKIEISVPEEKPIDKPDRKPLESFLTIDGP